MYLICIHERETSVYICCDNKIQKHKVCLTTFRIISILNHLTICMYICKYVYM